MSDSEEDSDLELQIALQRGLIKPGVVVEKEKPTDVICDTDGLQQALADLQNSLPWVERLDLTCQPVPPPKPMADQLGTAPNDLSGTEIENDFKREMKFYRQAQAAVLTGVAKLRKKGIPTQRPLDYFAEMLKSDAHMEKVREKLLSKQIAMERSEKAKKLRMLKKMGKQTQHEVLQKKNKQKKELLQAVKKFRKGKLDSLEFQAAIEDDTPKAKKQEKKKPNNQEHKPNKRRQKKNTKFGFGGQKKRSKYNDAKSAATDDANFNPKSYQSKGKKNFGGKKSNFAGKNRHSQGQKGKRTKH